ncbi:MAG: DUF2306 domain-containing protein [Bacteroidota bacterium]
MNRKVFFLAFLLIGAVSMTIMSIHYFTEPASGILGRKVFKDALWYQAAFYAHIGFGLIAILTGPIQFIKAFIEKRERMHRVLGYIYSGSVACSSLSGLIIAQFAMGGLPTQIGFSVLAVLWFTSLMMALKHIFAGHIQAHQSWMMINYALTFAAITQRTMLLFAFIPGLDFMPIYQWSAWLPWMINLVLVSLFINKRRSMQVAI